MTQINPNQINPGSATDKQVIAFDQATNKFTVQNQTGGGGGGNIIFVSEEFPTLGNNDTVIHNLNVSQADVLKGRYHVRITCNRGGNGQSLAGVEYQNNRNVHYWSALGASNAGDVMRQANDLRTRIDAGFGPTNVRVIIEDLWAVTEGDDAGSGNYIIDEYVVPTGISDIVISHGLGKIPSTIEIDAYPSTGTQSNLGTRTSMGLYTTATDTNRCMWWSDGDTPPASGLDTSNCVNIWRGSGYVSDVTDTTITITFNCLNGAGMTFYLKSVLR